MPGGIAAGDRAFFFDSAVASGGTPPTAVAPSGFTLLGTHTAAGGGFAVRHSVYYKDLSGSETTITGMAVGVTCNKALAVWRKSSGATWETPGDVSVVASVTSISNQVVNVPSGAVLVLAYGDDFGTVGTGAGRLTMNPAGTYAGAGTIRIGYINYGSSPADNTASSSVTAGGVLSSFYQRVLDPTITGTLSSTLGAATLAATGKVPSQGTLSATLGASTLAGVGTVANTVYTGTLSVTLGALTLSASGTVSGVNAAGEDGLEIGETATAVRYVLASASDGLVLDESTSRGLATFATATDQLVLDESESFVRTTYSAATDEVILSDDATGLATMLAVAADSLIVSESLSARKLWEPEAEDTATWETQAVSGDIWTPQTTDNATWTPRS